MSIDPRSLNAPNPAQWDEYDKPRPMVPAGRMTLKAPDKLIIESDADNNIRVVLDPVMITDAPPGSRDQIRFERVSSKPRATGRLAGTSRLTDYLLSTGTDPVRSDDAEQWITAIEQTAGNFFEAFVDWRAWDKDTEEELASTMTDFPQLADGSYQSYIVNPKTGLRVPAQYRIRYFVRQRRN